jgi:hypothetical protein
MIGQNGTTVSTCYSSLKYVQVENIWNSRARFSVSSSSLLVLSDVPLLAALFVPALSALVNNAS